MFTLPAKKPVLLALPIKKVETEEDDFSDVEEEIDSFQYKEPVYSSQENILAKYDNWQVSIDTLNYILKVDNNYSYFSDLESLLDKLFEHRVKFQLSQCSLPEIKDCIEYAHSDIRVCLGQLRNTLDYLGEKYGTK